MAKMLKTISTAFYDDCDASTCKELVSGSVGIDQYTCFYNI